LRFIRRWKLYRRQSTLGILFYSSSWFNVYPKLSLCGSRTIVSLEFSSTARPLRQSRRGVYWLPIMKIICKVSWGI
jgi:hypothetical protein